MSNHTMLDELYRYADWANAKVLDAAKSLTDADLDAPREIGFGSLRSILFHILAAEEIWLERWQLLPWRSFPKDPEGLSIEQIHERLRQISAKRRTFMDQGRANLWDQSITYRDSRGDEYTRNLRDLLLHVANHGIHHRAQALNILRKCERPLSSSIDFLFYKFAYPSTPQPAESLDKLKARGFEVATGVSSPMDWDAERINRYFAYHEWAMRKVLDLATQVNDEQLDLPRNMGPGTLRKTLSHLVDVEWYWTDILTTDNPAFPKQPADRPVATLLAQWQPICDRRNQFIASLDESSPINWYVLLPQVLRQPHVSPKRWCKSVRMVRTIVPRC